MRNCAFDEMVNVRSGMSGEKKSAYFAWSVSGLLVLAMQTAASYGHRTPGGAIINKNNLGIILHGQC